MECSHVKFSSVSGIVLHINTHTKQCQVNAMIGGGGGARGVAAAADHHKPVGNCHQIILITDN
ncbi:MAG TPA: hypothetical protein VE223_07365 [Nitrososphaeraceae archaeon]|nr:hypothetical protein [Nitrososphaeraceae archaeon]